MNPRTPTQIISENLRSGGVFPTLTGLGESLDEIDAIIAALDKELQQLQDRISPVLLSDEVPGPPPGYDASSVKNAFMAEEPRVCGLTADLKGIQRRTFDIQGRLRVITNWVSTITSEVQL